MDSISNDNVNINVNVNNNISGNNFDTINIFGPYFEGIHRIRTSNNLQLIDDNGKLIQTRRVHVPDSQLWNVEPVGDVFYFRNLATDRYISLPSPTFLDHTPIVVVPPGDPLLSRWIFRTIPFYSGVQMINVFSNKALDVPENLPYDDIQMIQFTAKPYYYGNLNQRFFIEVPEKL